MTVIAFAQVPRVGWRRANEKSCDPTMHDSIRVGYALRALFNQGLIVKIDVIRKIYHSYLQNQVDSAAYCGLACEGSVAALRTEFCVKYNMFLSEVKQSPGVRLSETEKVSQVSKYLEMVKSDAQPKQKKEKFGKIVSQPDKISKGKYIPWARSQVPGSVKEVTFHAESRR